ncbi:hypothetical protein U1Q18_031469 [Sarracenia purpurea var. burkii]
MPSQHERIDQLEQRMNGMEGLVGSLANLEQRVFDLEQREQSSTYGWEDVVEELRLQKEDISGRLNVLMRAMSNAPTGGSMDFSKARVPEPRSYGGARDAKEPDNFLFDIEQYFKAVKADSEESKTMLSPSNETLAPRTRVGKGEKFQSHSKTKSGGADSSSSKGRSSGGQHQSKSYVDKGKAPHQGANMLRTTISCFLCKGPHKIADCPQRRALNAMVSLPDNASQGSGSESESEEDNR